MAIFLCKGARMSIFSNLFKKKDEDNEIKEINGLKTIITQTNEDDEITAVIAAVVASMDEEEETVAAITAAIACMLGKSTSDFIVRNIKRTSEIESLWALNGRMKLMR
jgi:mannitol-1-phosphate/altronate dehydrogenase